MFVPIGLGGRGDNIYLNYEALIQDDEFMEEIGIDHEQSQCAVHFVLMLLRLSVI